MKSFPIKSILPGTVACLHVEDGDQVEAGDNVIGIECMKMQTDIAAEVAGKVRLRVELGEMIEQDQVLAEIEVE